MKTFNAYLTVKLSIQAKDKMEVRSVLENMDYSFTDPREDIPETQIEMVSEIQEWTDVDGESY